MLLCTPVFHERAASRRPTRSFPQNSSGSLSREHHFSTVIREMDPLSISASAIGIVTFALQAVKLLNDDLQNIKNAPAALRDAGIDLNALEPMLTTLQDAAKQNQDQLARNRRILLALENCFDVCKSFRQQLRAWSKLDSDGQLAMSSRVKMGLLGQERIKEFRTKLGDCKGTLTLVLVAEHLYVL